MKILYTYNKKAAEKLLTAAIAMTAVMLTASCEYKDLNEPLPGPPTFLLNFDGENVDSIPNDYLTVFYPLDEYDDIDKKKGYYVREINGRTAKITGIPAGRYKVTAWNKFLEHTKVDINADRNKIVAYAQQYFTTGETPDKVLDSLYYGQPVMDTSDYMVHANEEDFELHEGIENQFLTLYPDSMVITVEYKLEGIKSLELAKQVKGTLDNVAKCRYPAFDNKTKDSCTVMFDCQFDAQENTVYGKFYLFDIEPQELSSLSHHLILFFWLNGNNIYFPIDVTQAFEAYRNGDSRLLIKVSDMNIDLKDYVATTGTFDLNINGYEDVEIEISW